MSKNIKHEKKPLPIKAKRFIRHIFPSNFFTRLNKSFGLDTKKEKLFFRSFAIFIIAAVILQPQDTSLRDLSALSKEKGMQNLTGLSSVSHTAIGKRLQSITPESMELLLSKVSSEFRGRLAYENPFPKGMKVFDVTTYSVSASHYNWVATRQSRGNARFLFVMDSYSGTPDAIIDASSNLNDNKAFQKAINSASQGKYFVFDKGFNNFSVFKEIIESQKIFVTRFKENYVFNRTKKKKFPSYLELEENWYLEEDEIGFLGQKINSNQIEVRKITCRNGETEKSFTIITNDKRSSAKMLVSMYAYRWPIEVFFRHIKSNLNITHFPSHDQTAVRNWMFFIALSILCIQLINLAAGSKGISSLLMRHESFKILLRFARSVIRDWIIELTISLKL